MDAASRLRAALAGVLDAPGLLLGDDIGDRYRQDWRGRRGEPLAVLRPASPDAVAATMRVLHALGQKVVLQGGMTGLVHGAVAAEGEAVLSLERLNRIEEIDAVSGTATVQAGVPLEALQNAARAQGLFFPVDIGSRGSCQVGGIVSTNAGGNRVLRYGMTRSSVLGLEAVLADGTVVSRMGKVIKDNAGYDLKHLFIGSEGTLGIVTRALLILLPEPASRDTALVGLPDFEALVALLTLCRRRLGARLASFEVMWRDYFALVTRTMKLARDPFTDAHPLYVLIETMGAEGERDREALTETLAAFIDAHGGTDVVLASSIAESNQLWTLRDSSGEAARAAAPSAGFDVSLPLLAMEGWIARVQAELRGWGIDGFQIYGHVADGNLHLVIGYPRDAPEMRARINDFVYRSIGALGGSVSAEHGVGLDKKNVLALSRSPAEIDLMRRLKAALDPQGLLNAGRIFD